MWRRARNLRSKESQKLLTWGLTNFDTIEIAKKDTKFASLDVWLGQKDQIEVYSKSNIYKTIRKPRFNKLVATIIYDGPVKAPINKDEKVAKLIIKYDGNILSEHDLLALETVKKKNILSRILNSINYLIWGDV